MNTSIIGGSNTINNTKTNGLDKCTAIEIKHFMEYMMQHYTLVEIQEILSSDSLYNFYTLISIKSYA